MDANNTCRMCGTSIPPDDVLFDDCRCVGCGASKPPDDALCDICQEIKDEALVEEAPRADEDDCRCVECGAEVSLGRIYCDSCDDNYDI